jgi:hypothetical protein
VKDAAELAFHRGSRTYLGIGADPQIYLWNFGWWPHAATG